jgi:hypothetical protein
MISTRRLRQPIACRQHTTSATRTTSYGARRWRVLCRQSSSPTRTHVRPSQPGLHCEWADAGDVCEASATVARSCCLAPSDCSATAVSSATDASVNCDVDGRLTVTFSLKRSRHSSISVITTCKNGTSVLGCANSATHMKAAQPLQPHLSKTPQMCSHNARNAGGASAKLNAPTAPPTLSVKCRVAAA